MRSILAKKTNQTLTIYGLYKRFLEDTSQKQIPKTIINAIPIDYDFYLFVYDQLYKFSNQMIHKNYFPYKELFFYDISDNKPRQSY